MMRDVLCFVDFFFGGAQRIKFFNSKGRESTMRAVLNQSSAYRIRSQYLEDSDAGRLVFLLLGGFFGSSADRFRFQCWKSSMRAV